MGMALQGSEKFSCNVTSMDAVPFLSHRCWAVWMKYSTDLTRV